MTYVNMCEYQLCFSNLISISSQYEIGGGTNFDEVTLWEKELHKVIEQTTVTGITSETEFR